MDTHRWSERYALAAAVTLAALVVVNQPVVMLAVSLVGLTVGAVLLWKADLKRAGLVAFVGFAVTLAFATVALLR